MFGVQACSQPRRASTTISSANRAELLPQVLPKVGLRPSPPPATSLRAKNLTNLCTQDSGRRSGNARPTLMSGGMVDVQLGNAVYQMQYTFIDPKTWL